jgi:glycosyltransferase involved in cell wall biosynthesis
MSKPKLHILIPDKKLPSLSHAESKFVYSHFDVSKGQQIKPDSDLVFTQHYTNHFILLELIKWKGPYIVLMGGDVWNEVTDVRVIKNINIVLIKAYLVLTVSKNLADIVRERLNKKNTEQNVMSLSGGMWGIDENPNGICPKKFFFKNNFDFMGKDPSILMGINIGIARKYAGISKFAKAVRDCFGHSVGLFCAGKITDQDTADNLEKTYDIKMLGKRNDWPKFIHKFDIFAHPSMFDCFPRTLAESMCAKIPSIAFDIAGIPEVSRIPIMVDPDDSEQICRAIKLLISDKAFREYQAERLYEEAIEKTELHKNDMGNILLMAIGSK